MRPDGAKGVHGPRSTPAAPGGVRHFSRRARGTSLGSALLRTQRLCVAGAERCRWGAEVRGSMRGGSIAIQSGGAAARPERRRGSPHLRVRALLPGALRRARRPTAPPPCRRSGCPCSHPPRRHRALRGRRGEADRSRRAPLHAAVPALVGRRDEAALGPAPARCGDRAPPIRTRGCSRSARRLWKEFSFGRRVETRLMERLADGTWRFAAYVWSADGSDARLAPERGIRGAPRADPGSLTTSPPSTTAAPATREAPRPCSGSRRCSSRPIAIRWRRTRSVPGKATWISPGSSRAA